MAAQICEITRIETYTLPESLPEFVEFFKKALNTIPKRYRDNATIEIEAYQDYHGITKEITISYMRDKTKKDFELEATKEMERRLANEEREQQLLKTLLQKYGTIELP